MIFITENESAGVPFRGLWSAGGNKSDDLII